MAAGFYGVLVGIASLVCFRWLPQPIGAVVFWGATAIQLGIGARVCWRRTGLPFASAAMANGAMLAACLVILAFMGQPFPNLAPASWVLFGSGALMGPIFLWIESRVHQTKWAEWRRHMENKGVWDVLMFRHLPHLRDGRA